MQALVSQAELRALQAQINPHFLFNALNTLYGTIARENASARQLVLNLAGLFRYSFAREPGPDPDRGRTRYRAGLSRDRRAAARLRNCVRRSRWTTRLCRPRCRCFRSSRWWRTRSSTGSRRGGRRICAAVDPEGGRKRSRSKSPTRALSVNLRAKRGAKASGLANVRRRLALCYGDESNLEISSADDVTVVRFSLPCAAREPAHWRFKFVWRKIAAVHRSSRCESQHGRMPGF